MIGKLFGIALAGAVGSLARYGLEVAADQFHSQSWPVATWLTNLLGSLIFGLIWGMSVASQPWIDPQWRAILLVGFCGAFTTFSTYAFQNWQLLATAHWLGFGVNVLVQNLGALLAVGAGIQMATWLTVWLRSTP